MSSAFCQVTDVFLPGQGEKLSQSPAFQWEKMERINGVFYRSTRDPDQFLIHVKSATQAQRRHLADSEVAVDYVGLHFHDFDGFGVHIPALLVTGGGTAIAMCQKRHGSMADTGHQTDILMSRSLDHGATWERQRVIFEEVGVNTYLGPVVEDRICGDVLVTFWKIPAAVLDDLGYFKTYAEQGGGFWMIRSCDEGQSWSGASFVKPEPDEGGWIGWPNNGVHGIQLGEGPYAGRLVMPAFLYKEGEGGQVPGVRGGLLYSDDHGSHWKVGGVLPEGSDEVSLVETPGGGIYVSYRKNTDFNGRRHFARSADGGVRFSESGFHEDVADRNLHGGLACYAKEVEGKPGVLLFSNAPGVGTVVYLSQDGGTTWPVSRLIEDKPSRYSDLAVTGDGMVLCLFTNGEVRDLEKISVARFNLEWLTEKAAAPGHVLVNP